MFGSATEITFIKVNARDLTDLGWISWVTDQGDLVWWKGTGRLKRPVQPITMPNKRNKQKISAGPTVTLAEKATGQVTQIIHNKNLMEINSPIEKRTRADR